MLLQIKREIATLKVLKHPNIVRLHEVQYNTFFFFFPLSLFFFSLSLLKDYIFMILSINKKLKKKKKKKDIVILYHQSRGANIVFFLILIFKCLFYQSKLTNFLFAIPEILHPSLIIYSQNSNTQVPENR